MRPTTPTSWPRSATAWTTSGAPYVIENVPTAPLVGATMLCGSHFDLGAQGYGLRRHRLFEPHGFAIPSPGPCRHQGPALPVYGHAGGRSRRDGLTFPGTDAWRDGMGISWMSGAELREAIPPAFTDWFAADLVEAAWAHFDPWPDDPYETWIEPYSPLDIWQQAPAAVLGWF